MIRLRKLDYIFIALFIMVWSFYYFFEGHFKFDINRTFNLPFLIAIEVTAVCLLYGAWRFLSIKDGKQLSIKDVLENAQPPNTDEAKGGDQQRSHSDK